MYAILNLIIYQKKILNLNKDKVNVTCKIYLQFLTVFGRLCVIY